MKLHHGLRLTYAFQTLDYHPSSIQYVVTFIAYDDYTESMLIYNDNYLGVTSIMLSSTIHPMYNNILKRNIPKISYFEIHAFYNLI
jgi:hypothetical protein